MKVTTGTFKADDRTKQLVNEVLDSGFISIYGEKSRKFEQQFAALHNSRYATLSNSGTSALLVALQTLKEIHRWSSGDEVIVPATTFIATPNIVKHNRMIPTFVDIEYDTYGIDPSLIEAAITDRTRAIIPVHLFGQSSKMDEILEIAHAHDLKVIEDSCEAMFVTHNGKTVGSMGDIGCFSMYVAHLITAGVGGISITSNPEYAEKMRSLVNHGLSIQNLNLDENKAPQVMISREFKFDSVGHSFRITEFEAAIALAQLETHKRMLKKRRRNGKHYTASLELINKSYNPDFYRIPYKLAENEHGYMMYPIVLNPLRGIEKNEIKDYLKEYDIETRDMLPILRQPAYSYLNPADFPISNVVSQYGFYVGCHQDLTVEHPEQVKANLTANVNRQDM